MSSEIKHGRISIMTSILNGKKYWNVAIETWVNNNSITYKQITENFASYKEAKKSYDLIVSKLINKIKQQGE